MLRGAAAQDGASHERAREYPTRCSGADLGWQLIDKIVILEIKSERIKNANQLANIANELGALRAVRLGEVDRVRLNALSAELKRVNAKLWDVEFDPRMRCARRFRR